MPQPNLLFITTDQQRWDSLPCYGLEFMRTPNLDRIAREGLVFERCYVTAPLCVPCRGALMTGQWPSTSGVLGNNCGFDDRTPLWPAALGKTGRRTAAIGKMHFNPWDTLAGFDERIICEDKRHMYLPDDHYRFLQAHGIERAHPTRNPGYFEFKGASVTPLAKRFHPDAWVADQAAAWLGRQGRHPFAAWVSFPGPHDPYDPPQEMADLYYQAPIPPPIGSREELARKPLAQQEAPAKYGRNAMYQLDLSNVTPDQFRRWRAHYYANLTLIDEGIGKILAALEQAGTLEETLIVFCSDHGDALGDHGLPFKSFFYESMVHVPLLMRGPGVKPGARCGALISTLDLTRLFYRATGAAEPPTLQGEDPTPLLSNPDGTIRSLVFSENTGRAMVFDGRFKYVHYRSGECELYDLRTDPSETVSLAGQSGLQPVLERLRSELLQHWLRNQHVQAMATAREAHPLRKALNEEWERRQAAGERA